MFWKKKTQPTRVYLDWAAATPLLPAAKAAMEPYLGEYFGNPSAIHAEGQATRKAVEEARTRVAAALQVRPELVTWTSGGTEGNNLAIFGVVESLRATGRSYESMTVITTNIEHPSVGRACDELRRRGVQVRAVEVTETGKIDVQHLRSLMDESVVLFSTALINSDIGTIQPARAIKKILTEAEKKHDTNMYLHLDAAQAPLWVTCQFDSLQADVVTLDAAKCCGPKGVGVLIRSRRVQLVPATHGGGQENGLRPGTEHVSGVVGAAVAIAAAQDAYQTRSETVSVIRDQAITHMQTELPQVLINGAQGNDRVANNINISIPGLDTEFAAVVLDTHGFAVSTKSACSGAGGGASTVVAEILKHSASACPPELVQGRASSTLRITLGPDTTLEQLKKLTAVLKTHAEQMSQY